MSKENVLSKDPYYKLKKAIEELVTFSIDNMPCRQGILIKILTAYKKDIEKYCENGASLPINIDEIIKLSKDIQSTNIIPKFDREKISDIGYLWSYLESIHTEYKDNDSSLSKKLAPGAKVILHYEDILELLTNFFKEEELDTIPHINFTAEEKKLLNNQPCNAHSGIVIDCLINGSVQFTTKLPLLLESIILDIDKNIHAYNNNNNNNLKILTINNNLRFTKRKIANVCKIINNLDNKDLDLSAIENLIKENLKEINSSEMPSREVFSDDVIEKNSKDDMNKSIELDKIENICLAKNIECQQALLEVELLKLNNKKNSATKAAGQAARRLQEKNVEIKKLEIQLSIARLENANLKTQAQDQNKELENELERLKSEKEEQILENNKLALTLKNVVTQSELLIKEKAELTQKLQIANTTIENLNIESGKMISEIANKDREIQNKDKQLKVQGQIYNNPFVSKNNSWIQTNIENIERLSKIADILDNTHKIFTDLNTYVSAYKNKTIKSSANHYTGLGSFWQTHNCRGVQEAENIYKEWLEDAVSIIQNKVSEYFNKNKSNLTDESIQDFHEFIKNEILYLIRHLVKTNQYSSYNKYSFRAYQIIYLEKVLDVLAPKENSNDRVNNFENRLSLLDLKTDKFELDENAINLKIAHKFPDADYSKTLIESINKNKNEYVQIVNQRLSY